MGFVVRKEIGNVTGFQHQYLSIVRYANFVVVVVTVVHGTRMPTRNIPRRFELCRYRLYHFIPHVRVLFIVARLTGLQHTLRSFLRKLVAHLMNLKGKETDDMTLVDRQREKREGDDEITCVYLPMKWSIEWVHGTRTI